MIEAASSCWSTPRGAAGGRRRAPGFTPPSPATTGRPATGPRAEAAGPPRGQRPRLRAQRPPPVRPPPPLAPVFAKVVTASTAGDLVMLVLPAPSVVDVAKLSEVLGKQVRLASEP